MRSGRVRRRAKPLERTWARIFREAGARVQEKVFLRDMGLPGVSPADRRQIEVLATGSPLCSGIPVAVDSTCVSPLHADGLPWRKADVQAGVSLDRAEASKDDTYNELVDSSTVRLLTLACETGGRWSQRCIDVVATLAAHRARAAPRHLQRAARTAFASRWWALLSVAQQDALAATLVDDAVSDT